MYIDQNGILCAWEQNESTEWMKKYQHNLSGYLVEDFDKIVFVWHKKEVKEIQWKDLGQNMEVFWIAERSEADVALDPMSIVSWIALFQWFDEEKWEKYYFLPRYSVEKMQSLQKKLEDVWIDLDLKKNEKGVVFTRFEEQLETQTVAFLFGLALVYGKWEINEWDLKSVKIQIPLFGQYIQKKENLDMYLNILQKSWVFVTHNIQESNDGIVYQIVVGDYELLYLWNNLYQNIENVEKISKYEYMLEAKIKLLDYLKSFDLTNEQKLADLDNATVKILKKG